MVTIEDILHNLPKHQGEMSDILFEYSDVVDGMDQWGRQQSIAFYEWARVYNMSHMTEHLQAGKLPTVEQLWEKYEQSQKGKL